LGQRLRQSHPHLFTRHGDYGASDGETDRPLAEEVSRILAIVGLIIAALACYALGAIMRSKMSEDLSPLVRTSVPRLAHAGLAQDLRNGARGLVATFGPPPA